MYFLLKHHLGTSKLNTYQKNVQNYIFNDLNCLTLININNEILIGKKKAFVFCVEIYIKLNRTKMTTLQLLKEEVIFKRIINQEMSHTIKTIV